MRIASLGSGSRGNATLVKHKKTTLLIDCGFSLRETEGRLERLGIDASEVDAILVTHEHTDHIRGVGAFARKHKTPVWMTHGTCRASNTGVLPDLNEIVVEEELAIRDLLVKPFAVPHDAAEPCQFHFSCGSKNVGLLTDTGMVTPHIIDMLSGLNALLLECNHDLAMLQDGEYPPALKMRVGSDYGHLNNDQAADLLEKIDTANLNFVAAMHISDKNNTTYLARQALSDALGWQEQDIQVAHQDKGLDWVNIN